MGIYEKYKAQRDKLDKVNAVYAAKVADFEDKIDLKQNEIDMAIDAENYDLVAKLTNEISDLETQRDAAERIRKRKEMVTLPRSEMAADFAQEVAKQQKDIDKQVEQLEKAIGSLGILMLNIADSVLESWKLRENLLALAGIGQGAFVVAGKDSNLDFNYVQSPANLLEKLMSNDLIREAIKKIDPKGFEKINGATASRGRINR